MKAAITGATGFVGKQVVWELLSCAWRQVWAVKDLFMPEVLWNMKFFIC